MPALPIGREDSDYSGARCPVQILLLRLQSQGRTVARGGGASACKIRSRSGSSSSGTGGGSSNELGACDIEKIRSRSGSSSSGTGGGSSNELGACDIGGAGSGRVTAEALASADAEEPTSRPPQAMHGQTADGAETEAAAEAEEQDEKMCQLRYDLCAMLGDEGIEAHRAAAAAAADAAPTERPNSEQAYSHSCEALSCITS